MEQIIRDSAEGRRIMLASAAPSLYVEHLARLLNVDTQVSTRSTWVDGKLTHRIGGENCYGPAKLEGVRNLIGAEGLMREHLHIRFYSDDFSDLPLFEWADEAIAVNPSRALRHIAARRGWRILDWRA